MVVLGAFLSLLSPQRSFSQKLLQRELICQRLDKVLHVFSNQRPEGAYYVFPGVTAEHTASKEFAIDLLNNTKVAVTPGSAFGPSSEHHVRMAYCVDEDTINLVFDRIENFFRQI